MSADFELFLFSSDPATIAPTVSAGVAGIVVDWERVGKRHRQAGADTQIGEDTVDDLRRVRASTSGRILCRIDNNAELLEEQIEAAVASGADEILLPMVRGANEVERVLAHARGRVGVGILVETEAVLEQLDDVAGLPLSRAYLGLNDLAIDRGTTNIFDPLVDGTIEEVRGYFSVPFGVAGLTVVDAGAPIPCRLIVGELSRLDCGFSFLRRSYHADIRNRDPVAEIPRLLAALAAASRRDADDVRKDREALIAAVEQWTGVLTSV
ncbi:MAG: aldolase [Actinobacteria bacterium]|nr:MAG: aldolase [Actinomycetota bacterium]